MLYPQRAVWGPKADPIFAVEPLKKWSIDCCLWEYEKGRELCTEFDQRLSEKQRLGSTNHLPSPRRNLRCVCSLDWVKWRFLWTPGTTRGRGQSTEHRERCEHLHPKCRDLQLLYWVSTDVATRLTLQTANWENFPGRLKQLRRKDGRTLKLRLSKEVAWPQPIGKSTDAKPHNNSELPDSIWPLPLIRAETRVLDIWGNSLLWKIEIKWKK